MPWDTVLTAAPMVEPRGDPTHQETQLLNYWGKAAGAAVAHRGAWCGKRRLPAAWGNKDGSRAREGVVKRSLGRRKETRVE